MTHFTEKFKKVTYYASTEKKVSYIRAENETQAKERILENHPYATRIRVSEANYNTFGEKIKP
jgi:hypothetical protein